MSWRDEASPQTQADLDSLFNDSVEAAADVLERGNTLTPFSLVITVDGSRSMRRLDASVSSTDEETNSARLTLPDDRDLLRARAVILDVRVVGADTDALKIIIEHRDGQALDAVVPYTNSDDAFLIDTDSITIALGTQRLWRPRGATPSE
ncbi:putative protein OS=Tsukamurella paurometabola (strain ATCC 8368 / DSM / CCUG 35730 /CIP 100753 / JCM 10117 / KCTC 9821 / NBRC 16120 / NCIMB 702349/ NCTC 13040) OX=521096 GN=Tpau_3452 PE=4 SV=1 [Tsukamurella paurometabola]|uniref:Uncharacterized protein n=1 Tax=Tsukamurella paurometabola (strain ATCC 8368 / DSM 20162 / CCUG 35730 / CIP 100753 / JCM 10117 / KCTC 9821 / NBRC 16120 / NCIMB 702349 / NCTC 13040) TaxID=521096 RepID=D5UX16_TSUPD|nr:hypothetical protein [Tsukamurella paurometabola]ADG80035.1 conserved hypothetical protein [Tsukamurella paurometabola DSM 20162]SUP38139.1 Uncharacterised protein [Tsukamurella paurometabola]